MRRSSPKIIYVILVAVVLLIGGGSWALFVNYGTQETVQFTVDHRERVISRNSEGRETSRFMVWADMADGTSEVFENTDTIWHFKFNSADLQGRMRPGAVCEAKVVGFRVGFLSWNRNIIQVDCDRPGQ